MSSQNTERLIEQALIAIAEEKAPMYNAKEFLTSQVTRDFFALRLRTQEKECFDVLFLDNQHRMIACRRMFTGTVDSAAVYPREVLKEALKYNASAVILAHNHPSGDPSPSIADNRITARLKDGLSLVDIRVLDHVIVGESGTYSYQENGAL